jgi:hypothetical protein
LLADDFLTPNGLAFSPDETILYLNNSRRGHIRAFGFLPNWIPSRRRAAGTKRAGSREPTRTVKSSNSQLLVYGVSIQGHVTKTRRKANWLSPAL